MTYLEHLENFHLDLRSPRYSKSLYVSCLGINPGRGWNHDLEESYLPEYSEHEAKSFTQGTSRTYLRPISISVPDPSPISRYSECTKMTSFSLLGFSN